MKSQVAAVRDEGVTTQTVLLPDFTTVLSRFGDDPRKLRGGYYTPSAIARVLATWAIQSPSASVLEPSCGDGQILAEAAQLLGSGGRLIGVELFEDEAAKARVRSNGKAIVETGDFFDWYRRGRQDGLFDAVLGNPPFLRFHTFPEDHREAAFAIMKSEGLSPTRLTNAWVPFVVAATKALRVGGRLAMVLPAELLQVSYAGELRGYLARKYRRLVIVTFGTLLFAETQQETVLLFGIREDTNGARMKWLELDGLEDLKQIASRAAANGVPADLDHAREKWIQYYLTETELALVRAIEQSKLVTQLGELASVDVGVVTGRNEFFVVRPSEARAAGITRWCTPIVGRSSQVPGTTLTVSEWELLRTNDERCLLVRLPERLRDRLPPNALAYVTRGEQAGIHEGYKCRIRQPIWWSVPSVWTPDAFLLRQIHEGPRIIANNAGATCTDTIHRLRLRKPVPTSWLAAASINSMTFAFAEIRGRSYGGGVLELEPSEAEGLPFPLPGTKLDVQRVNRAIRDRDIDTALDFVDSCVLESAGLTKVDAALLRSIWRRLYRRRLARKPMRIQSDLESA